MAICKRVDPQTNKLFDVIHGRSVHPIDPEVMQFLNAEDTNMEVFPVVQNFDNDANDFSPPSPTS